VTHESLRLQCALDEATHEAGGVEGLLWEEVQAGGHLVIHQGDCSGEDEGGWQHTRVSSAGWGTPLTSRVVAWHGRDALRLASKHMGPQHVLEGSQCAFGGHVSNTRTIPQCSQLQKPNADAVAQSLQPGLQISHGGASRVVVGDRLPIQQGKRRHGHRATHGQWTGQRRPGCAPGRAGRDSPRHLA